MHSFPSSTGTSTGSGVVVVPPAPSHTSVLQSAATWLPAGSGVFGAVLVTSHVFATQAYDRQNESVPQSAAVLHPTHWPPALQMPEVPHDALGVGVDWGVPALQVSAVHSF